ncbi:zinc-dependent metalloprotease [Nitratiruptor sp. SB155-2]|uniref:zinc-dependent metalloprotease n=1 Tax=Nitratiruptor sp. (strain SB155-2) TaxID=387092 RepID=UPI0001586FDB|nr:zinc-dependent metalloprotease [Nitratiruptor sp. SB155-2]BAF70505.1 hypothetical protein NIS_1398 [Nitratiruptor sp. SB155-2]
MNLDQVIKLYIALFDRAPEKEGVHNWYEAAIVNGWDEGQIAQNMIYAAQEVVNSNPDYLTIYPQYAHVDTNDPNAVRSIIESVYVSLFDKTYQDDPKGIDGWVGAVLEGQNIGNIIASIIYVADGIANGTISADTQTVAHALAYKNKIEVGKYVAQKSPTFLGDFDIYQSFIKNVTDDAESVADAIVDINNYFDSSVTSYDALPLEVRSLLIDQGAKIDKDIITYSFPQVMPLEYQDEISYSNHWQPLNLIDQSRVREAFHELGSVLGVRFEEVDSNGDIRFSKVTPSSQDEAGFAVQEIYDGKMVTSGVGSDIFLANDYDVIAAPKDVILHEIGHAFGLKHPFEGSPTMPSSYDNTLYTIMSYTQEETALPEITMKNLGDSFEYTVQTDPIGRKSIGYYDLLALRYLYGSTEHDLTNETYDISDLYNQHAFAHIVDDGGIDTVVLDSQEPAYIDLRGGEFLSSIGDHLPFNSIKQQIQEQMSLEDIPSSYFDDIYAGVLDIIQQNPSFKAQIYQGKNVVTLPENSIENIVATGADEIIYDNALDNRIITGSGNDIIYVSQGDDTIDGGEGIDTVYLPDKQYQEIQTDGILYLVSDDQVIALQNIEHIV